MHQCSIVTQEYVLLDSEIDWPRREMHVKIHPCTAMLLFSRCSAWRGSHETSLAEWPSKGVLRRILIHDSRLVREAASRLMCSRKGHILNFIQQWAYKRPTWTGQQSGTNGVLTKEQHIVDVTAGQQEPKQRGSPQSLNNDTHSDPYTKVRPFKGVL